MKQAGGSEHQHLGAVTSRGQRWSTEGFDTLDLNKKAKVLLDVPA